MLVTTWSLELETTFGIGQYSAWVEALHLELPLWTIRLCGFILKPIESDRVLRLVSTWVFNGKILTVSEKTGLFKNIYQHRHWEDTDDTSYVLQRYSKCYLLNYNRLRADCGHGSVNFFGNLICRRTYTWSMEHTNLRDHQIEASKTLWYEKGNVWLFVSSFTFNDLTVILFGQKLKVMKTNDIFTFFYIEKAKISKKSKWGNETKLPGHWKTDLWQVYVEDAIATTTMSQAYLIMRETNVIIFWCDIVSMSNW